MTVPQDYRRLRQSGHYSYPEVRRCVQIVLVFFQGKVMDNLANFLTLVKFHGDAQQHTTKNNRPSHLKRLLLPVSKTVSRRVFEEAGPE
jgi:hypothetical protein